jgi:hypothetical protein
MPKENYGLLEINAIKDTVIVLDASESAGECQETIVKTAQQLIEKLPAGTIRGLYFLSNPERYETGKLLRKSAGWWEQNKLRGSFLTPVLEIIQECRVVVIGSGLIYDLEDWQDSRWNSNLYFIKVKDSLRGNLKIGQEFQDLSQVYSFLYDPIISIEINGSGFMPFYWNNPEYKLSTAGSIKLVGLNLDNPSVLLGYWGSDVKADIVRKAGEEEPVTLKSIDYQDPDSWNSLDAGEAEIFHRAALGYDFSCLICGQKHPALRIRCDVYSILGEPIYPSLGKKRGFVLFKEIEDKVYFKFHPVSVIKIDDLSVAISRAGKEVGIYKLNPVDNQWSEKFSFTNYQIGGDSRIVFF